MKVKKVVILGSTGSIGRNALKIMRLFKERFKVLGLVANKNIRLLKSQVEEFNPEYVGIFDQEVGKNFKYEREKVLLGQEGIIKISTLKEVDIVLFAIPGFSGFKIFFETLKSGKRIAVANKEILVSFKEIIRKKVKFKHQILPVDSEHSAIFRCMLTQKNQVKKVYLTCSGGPFLNWGLERLKNVGVKEVLNHPKWKMGPKITVDSATLMNKGLEIIEAQTLFDLSIDKIEVLIHPEAVIHGMVEFVDSSIMASLSVPDMKLPILYALNFPKPLLKFNLELDFLKLRKLTFKRPNLKKFRCLKLALEVAKLGGTFPCVLNAANEVCVDYFLKRKIKFLDIPDIIEKTLAAHKIIKNPNFEDIINTDDWARRFALSEVNKKC